MTFQDALTAMQAGHRVRRGAWGEGDYMFLRDGEIIGCASVVVGKPMCLPFPHLRSSAILATDWQLVPA